MAKFIFFQAHPDDLTVNCGYLLHYLMKRSEKKHDIRINSLCCGETGLPKRYTLLEGPWLGRIRTREMQREAAIHGIPPDRIDFMGYHCGLAPALSRKIPRSFVQKYVDYLDIHDPDIIFAPEPLWTFYTHPEHLKVGRVLYLILREQLASCQPKLYYYTTLKPNFFFPCYEQFPDLSWRLVAAHRSQDYMMKYMKYLIYPISWWGGRALPGWKFAEPYRQVFFRDPAKRKENDRAKVVTRIVSHMFYSGLPVGGLKEDIFRRTKAEKIVARENPKR